MSSSLTQTKWQFLSNLSSSFHWLSRFSVLALLLPGTGTKIRCSQCLLAFFAVFICIFSHKITTLGLKRVILHLFTVVIFWSSVSIELPMSRRLCVADSVVHWNIERCYGTAVSWPIRGRVESIKKPIVIVFFRKFFGFLFHIPVFRTKFFFKKKLFLKRYSILLFNKQ